MNRARVRLAAALLLCGLITAATSSLLLGMAISLVTEGPSALLKGLRLGAEGWGYVLLFATLPAILLGSLLWLRAVRSPFAWAATGALAGLACYALAFVIPGWIGRVAAVLFGGEPVKSGLAFAIAGALAALLFLALIRLSTAKSWRRRPARPA